MEFLIVILILFPSVILHECAHGWVAYLLGDSTAKLAGRLTLNPIKHIDPLGTIILPGILLILKALGYPSVVLGWAKPVPVNALNFSHPRRDMMLVAIAGPIVNVSLAVLASLILKLNLNPSVNAVTEIIIFVNLLLAVFNLIPIPPLDGSRLIMWLLPKPMADFYSQLEGFGIFIVIVLLYSCNLFDQVVFPLVVIGAKYLGVHP